MTGSIRQLRLAAWACLPAVVLCAAPLQAKVAIRPLPPVAPPAVAPAVAAEPAPPADKPADKPAEKPVEAVDPAKAKADADKAAAEKAAADKAKAEEAKKREEAQLRSRRSSRDARKTQLISQNLTERQGPLEQYFKVVQDRGILRIDGTGLPTQTGVSQQFRIKGIEAAWSFNRYQTTQFVPGPGGAMVRQPASVINMSRTELGNTTDEDYYQVSFSSSPTSMSISGQSILRNVSLIQSNPVQRAALGVVRAAQPVTLSVYEYQANGQGIAMRQATRLSARTLSELRAKHPAEFRKHAMPLLRKLSDMSFLQPGAAEVYSVLDDVQADVAITAKLTELLPLLESEDFAVRDQAAKQLRDLGQAGVLAALRLDRGTLTDEQAGQLGRYISEYRRRELSDVESTRQDTAFLTDCLEHSDPLVRASAKRQLERVLGKPISFDPALTGNALGEAADKVRAMVQESTAGATTQPAADPNAAPAPAIGPAVRPAILVKPQIAPVELR